MRKMLFFSCVLCFLTLAACIPAGYSSPTPASFSTQPPTTTIIPSPTSPATSTPTLFLTASAIPTHSLERLMDKLPSATPASGFIVLEMPTIIPPAGMITVTIFTAPSALCSIKYHIPNSQWSQPPELEPQIAAANGICSWQWIHVSGKKLLDGPYEILINANGEVERYSLILQQ